MPEFRCRQPYVRRMRVLEYRMSHAETLRNRSLSSFILGIVCVGLLCDVGMDGK